MNSVSISATISPEDRALIVADLLAALKPMLDDAAPPLLVDGNRMGELLGISRPQVDRMRAEGIIPSLKIGKRRLYVSVRREDENGRR